MVRSCSPGATASRGETLSVFARRALARRSNLIKVLESPLQSSSASTVPTPRRTGESRYPVLIFRDFFLKTTGGACPACPEMFRLKRIFSTDFTDSEDLGNIPFVAGCPHPAIEMPYRCRMRTSCTTLNSRQSPQSLLGNKCLPFQTLSPSNIPHCYNSLD